MKPAQKCIHSRTILSHSRLHNTFRSFVIRKSSFLSAGNVNAIIVVGPARLLSLTRTNIFSGYQQTYIIGTKITFDTATRDSCTTLEEHKTISLQTIESVRKIIDPRLLTLEHEYSGSRAFYAGTCHLCPKNTCTRINGHPCLHPQEIRPSLESVGFDISKTTSELLHIELQWSNDAHLPEYLTLVSGLFTKESAYAPISTRISSLLTV